MPKNPGSITFEDYNREKSTVSVRMGEISSINYDAKRSALNTLKTELAAITKGEIRGTALTINTTESIAAVTDNTAQRESKWLIVCRDTTQYLDVGNTIENQGYGNLFTIEVPTADISLLTNNSDELVLASYASLVTAIEAVAQSPTGGDSIQVVKIQHVGRNL